MTAATGLSAAVLTPLPQPIVLTRLGHEKPYPAATISRTADHYPEFVIFGIATEGGATLLIMTWFLNYFLIRSKWSKVGRYLPEISVILGMMGALALMGSTATLDTGKHNTTLACQMRHKFLHLDNRCLPLQHLHYIYGREKFQIL